MRMSLFSDSVSGLAWLLLGLCVLPQPCRVGTEAPVQRLRPGILIVGHLVQSPDDPAHWPVAGIRTGSDDLGKSAELRPGHQVPAWPRQHQPGGRASLILVGEQDIEHPAPVEDRYRASTDRDPRSGEKIALSRFAVELDDQHAALQPGLLRLIRVKRRFEAALTASRQAADRLARAVRGPGLAPVAVAPVSLGNGVGIVAAIAGADVHNSKYPRGELIALRHRKGVSRDVPCSGAVIVGDDVAVTRVRDAASVMAEGAAILACELSPAGFTFQLTRRGRSCGGDFAAGRFTRGDQYLEIHYRYSLGLVTYGWGDDRLGHAAYLAGLGQAGAYPGYGTGPWTGSVTWPATWPARCQVSATAIAAGLNAAFRPRGSHVAELFREARFRQHPLTCSRSSRHQRGLLAEKPHRARGRCAAS
jgi:hypothetical protein